MTLNSSAVRDNPWTSQNETRTLIGSLKLAQVQTLRTMHLTLGAFSLALALLTVHRIISDAKRAAALQAHLRKVRFAALRNVHPAETFPLVLATGAVIQQIIFVAVQSTSLSSVLSNQCRGLAMITLPAIFLLGIITLVFGIDMAIRALKADRFAPKGKWTTTICIGFVAFLTLMMWMPTVAWPMYNRCFGSLIWFPMRYELLMLVVLVILIGLFLALTAIISIQLMRTSDVDPNQRIAASRMCYYLVMSALLYTLVLPVEVQAHRRDFNSTYATSRIAEVALFCSGIVIAFVHLFLRVNATRLVIKPMSEMNSPTKQKRPKLRLFGPSDLEMNISGPLALQGGRRPESRQGLIDVGPEKNRFDFEPGYFERSERPLTPASARSQGPIDPTKWPLPPDPVQTGFFAEQKDGTTGLHRRNKSNYSLFPTRAEEVPRLPATVYSPPRSAGAPGRFSQLAMRRQSRKGSIADTKSVTDVGEAFSFLVKPPPLFSSRHNRNQSTDSSATVQIGLRFSLAPAILGAGTYSQDPPPVPPLRRDESESSIETLDLPIQSPSTNTTPSELEGETLQAVAFPQPPKPTLASPAKPSPGKTAAFPVLSPATYLQDQRQKILPPTPRSALPGPPPTVQPPVPLRTGPGLSGLRMNPISPASTLSPTSPAAPSIQEGRSNSLRSTTSPSPTARIPLGAGTMARSPPANGWI
ncbi:uncharacterized protein N0V89_009404 [Didymosphaeria variabile]|uniref:Uncharacterized protein n=1 Tax=Didymosphaeria variabile TaxID=1932322 RepID=A0A9W8XDR4_9PLEO|nr:uncharacterized protein N0V89_009404 [Didymosphaeria variabile]KAJ4348032.1 hypothetical protein N0V89_009404 [Didymosphaeria variabile]